MSNPRSLRLWTAFLLISVIVGLFSIATHLVVVWQWAARWGVWRLFAVSVVAVFLACLFFRLLAARVLWYKFKDPPNEPLFRLTNLGILALKLVRDRLRRENLFDTSDGYQTISIPKYVPANRYARTPDGTFTEPNVPGMGAAGTTFGRNVPLKTIAAHRNQVGLLDPDPRVISKRLMTREHFQAVEGLNLLAAAWIQFQVHDWFNHPPGPDDEKIHIELPKDSGFANNTMSIPRTPVKHWIQTPSGPVPAYENTVTHWWDASQLYGSDVATLTSLRQPGTPYLRTVDHKGATLLPVISINKTKRFDLTGFNRNWWVGLSLLHTLFTREHNAICDHLRKSCPSWDDEQIFHTARLINAAVMAKIQTIQWTPAILDNPKLHLAMRANWSGLLGGQWRKVLGRWADSDILCGIPGSDRDHHGVNYAMTEEFVSVYRMHPLLPDAYVFYDVTTGEEKERRTLEYVQGEHARDVVEEHGLPNLFYSFGIAHPGKVTLRNYPAFLQHFKSDLDVEMDLAAVDILRDRERGLPRYNEFRRRMHMKPLRTIDEIHPDKNISRIIRDVYKDDIEKVDLMVGLLAEEPRPSGFGISDTAFRVFVLMASRRLKSDRFFTEDYRPEIYTHAGLEWIHENDFGSVLIRHYPQLRAAINTENPFRPWCCIDKP